MSDDYNEADIKAVFDQFDADHSGFIDSSEIKKVCELLGVSASKDQIQELMTSADENGDGKIDYKEFKNAILS